MMRMNLEPPFEPPYPAIEPFDAGLLEVGDGHRIYYEQCGQPQGLPLLFLHGGPGSGCSPRHRRLFNPARHRMVLFDQRGCGRSQPRGGLQANTSAHLLADMERLRAHLGIAQWQVVGGSWGAGLALAYAAAHPAACAGLVLRAVFLGRDSDIDWFFRGARELLPEAWQRLAQQAPPSQRETLLPWLHAGLQHTALSTALAHAQAWQAWEAALSHEPAPAPADAATAAALVDKYRVQSHYLVNRCFWHPVPLLMRTPALAGLPCTIVHGRLDWVCRPQAAWELHAALPGSRLRWVDACGHGPYAPPMAAALAQAVEETR